MNEFQKKLYLSCAEMQSDGGVKCNIGNVIENLLLFDQYIIKSNQLKELPELVKVFGFEGLKELFEIGALKIHCEPLTIGQIGQFNPSPYNEKNKILPLYSYSFTMVRMANEKEFIHNCFKIVEDINILKGKQKIKFKGIVAKNLLKYNTCSDNNILSQLKNDLAHNDYSIKLSIAKVLLNNKDIAIEPSKINIDIKQNNENEFFAETDLHNILRISKYESHKLIEKALLGLAGKNKMIEDMRNFNALIGFNEDELSLFDSKLEFLSNSFNSQKPLNTLRKVIEINNFPDINKAVMESKINVDNLLKVRQDNACKEFREWIWSISDTTNNKEIENYTMKLKDEIAHIIRTPQGKIIRWVAGTGLNFIPVVGNSLSSIIGVLDTFLFEKVFPQNGVKYFIGRKLPSIYHN